MDVNLALGIGQSVDWFAKGADVGGWLLRPREE
jgi:hypothetical protein